MSYIWIQDQYRTFSLEFENPDLSYVSKDEHIDRLSKIRRWSGAVRRNVDKTPISVLEHAVTVCAITEQLLYKDYGIRADIPVIAWEALHHDDEEAFPPYDIPSPLKRLILTPAGLEYTERVRKAVWRDIYGYTLGGRLDKELQEVIDLADKMCAYMEAISLWPYEVSKDGIDYSVRDQCMSDVFGFGSSTLDVISGLSQSYRGLTLPIVADFKHLIHNPSGRKFMLKPLVTSLDVWKSAYEELDTYLKRGEHEART